jgi:hypothetical protein
VFGRRWNGALGRTALRAQTTKWLFWYELPLTALSFVSLRCGSYSAIGAYVLAKLTTPAWIAGLRRGDELPTALQRCCETASQSAATVKSRQASPRRQREA